MFLKNHLRFFKCCADRRGYKISFGHHLRDDEIDIYKDKVSDLEDENEQLEQENAKLQEEIAMLKTKYVVYTLPKE